ncbi:hypothetical protein F2P56_001489 [Juglans regia]|uniref:Chromo domain-containing protein n=2 Tax=Juglans regia TaxID=51240 RepID=A0A833Y704_JUGRE|nr:uncharacterized protein LOC108985779 [Juglans regia]KAF5480773.1 hypothetical protein F2P56_001489 [Juglans regia]
MAAIFIYQGTRLHFTSTNHPQSDGQTEVALYGAPPPTLIQYVDGTTHNEAVGMELKSRDEILIMLKKNLLDVQTVSQVSRSKLAARYCGSFKVLECIGEVAYKLELPPNSSVHPIFHVSRLKKYVGPNSQISPVLPLVDSHGIFKMELEAILDRRMTVVDNRPFIELLVKWRGVTKENSTWEPVEQLRAHYPDLVGKVFQREGQLLWSVQ